MDSDPEERRTPHVDSVGGRVRAYISSNLALFVISGCVAVLGFIAIATDPKYPSLTSALVNGFGAGLSMGGIAFFIGFLVRKARGLVERVSAERNSFRGFGILASATSRKSGGGLASSLTPEGRGSGDGSLLNSAPASERQWETPTASIGVGLATVDTNGSIFVVHGHARTVLHELVRVLERGTGREVVVLHEQSNSGRTILEKFEEHASAAAYAVVLLTGDDEGRALSALEPRARGRQNVIFELGFFFGKLGRERVTVLVDRHVEKPSDVDGLVYIPIDEAGAWKQALARELQSASIQVNYSRIP